MKYILISSVFFFCLFFDFSSTADSKSLVFPYQKCNPRNEIFTEKLASQFKDEAMEAVFCPECSINENNLEEMKDIKHILSYSIIPKQCFLAMAIRGNQLFKNNQYISCLSRKNKIKKVPQYKGQKICANENYIDMIQESFVKMADCFNYSPQRQKEIFHLINQESGGILNVLSNRKARCLGQVTKRYIKGVNRYIRSRNWKNPMEYSEIYDEVIQRCPFLEKKLLLKKVKRKSGKIKLKDKYPFTCPATHDPYTCLFYTFLGIEINYQRIQDNFNSIGDYMGNRDFTEAEKQQFQLPIRLNEMLSVQAIVNGEKKDLLFWDDSELYDTLTFSKKEILIVKAEKIPLFKNQEDISLMLKYWAHNGGSSFSGPRMIFMVERLKQFLTKTCKANSKKPRCLMKREIQSGEGLPSESAQAFFEKDLLRYYPSRSKKRREEVSKYVRKMMKTNKQTFGYGEKSTQTNKMLHYYKKAFKFKGISLSDTKAKAFQQNVSEVCPNLDFKDVEHSYF